MRPGPAPGMAMPPASCMPGRPAPCGKFVPAAGTKPGVCAETSEREGALFDREGVPVNAASELDREGVLNSMVSDPGWVGILVNAASVAGMAVLVATTEAVSGDMPGMASGMCSPGCAAPVCDAMAGKSTVAGKAPSVTEATDAACVALLVADAVALNRAPAPAASVESRAVLGGSPRRCVLFS